MQHDVQMKHSELGIASCVVGSATLVVQLGIFAAVVLGVRDNQGIIYAVSIPFVMYCVGGPLSLLLAITGLVLPERNRYFAKLGLVLTLAGPLVFGLFVAARLAMVNWRQCVCADACSQSHKPNEVSNEW